MPTQEFLPSAGLMPDSLNMLPEHTLPTPAATLSESSSYSEPASRSPELVRGRSGTLTSCPLNPHLDGDGRDKLPRSVPTNRSLEVFDTGIDWLSDLLRADLNQVFFERVQPSAPILNRSRYFSWASSPTRTGPQRCLQHAMWTLAASFASQSDDVRERLYQSTLRLLESVESADEPGSTVENAQA